MGITFNKRQRKIIRSFLKKFHGKRRKRMSNKRRPTIAILDSQSVRSGYSQSQKGIDGFKRVKG